MQLRPWFAKLFATLMPVPPLHASILGISGAEPSATVSSAVKMKARFAVEAHIQSVPSYVFAKGFGNRSTARKCFDSISQSLHENSLYEVRLWDMHNMKLLAKRVYGSRVWESSDA